VTALNRLRTVPTLVGRPRPDRPVGTLCGPYPSIPTSFVFLLLRFLFFPPCQFALTPLSFHHSKWPSLSLPFLTTRLAARGTHTFSLSHYSFLHSPSELFDPFSHRRFSVGCPLKNFPFRFFQSNCAPVPPEEGPFFPAKIPSHPGSPPSFPSPPLLFFHSVHNRSS